MANMELIEAKTSTSSSVTFSSIPATYTDLKLVASMRSDRTGQVESNVTLKFNGSSSNYSRRELDGNGTNATSANASAQSAYEYIYCTANNATANTFNNVEIYIPNYASSNNKAFSVDNVQPNNTTTAYIQMGAGLWSDATAISSITLTEQYGNNFSTGSTFYLYGISNVTSTSKATGGIVSTDGVYNYHIFPYTSTFTPTMSITADYLVVAGGGGGGVASGGGAGGGGAGGLRSTVDTTGGGGTLGTALSLTAQAYTVTVGAGGVTAQTAGQRGGSGSDSVFSTITSTGGGGGGGASQTPSTGGSGGGGGGNTGGNSGAAGTANQGFAGGNSVSGDSAGGGGGGAGSAGAVGGAAGAAGGAGGTGVSVSITGIPVFYAGGGGGGNDTRRGGNPGLGGAGGGGNGGGGNTNQNPVRGTAGLGGGGGGTQTDSNGNPGGVANGGSGIVIIRYAI